MSKIAQIKWLIYRSIYLDIKLIANVPNIHLSEKFLFIINKYMSITKILVSKKTNTIHKRKSFSGTFYFNDEFATGLLQSIYCHNFRLKSYLPVNPIVIDIGANIGQFCTFSTHYLGAKNVISFEPIKSCFETLKLNSRKSVINAAVGSSNTRQEIFTEERDIMASLVKPVVSLGGRFSSEIVDVIRLDEVKEVIKIPRIDLLKIDTEGYELEILRSASLSIHKSRFLLVECSVNRPSNGSVDEVCKYMVEKYPTMKIVDIFNPGRRNNQIESIEILWRNTEAD